MKKKVSLSYFMLLICTYMFVFQNFIQYYIKSIQYWDEIISLSIIPIYILKRNKTKIKKYDLGIIICLIIFIIIGIYSNIKYMYQEKNLVVSDVLLCMKFFMMYYLSNLVFKVEDIPEKYSKHLKIITCILVIMTVLNYIFKIWPYGYRYGIMINKLFYTHPTYLAAICVFLLASLIMFDRKKSKLYFILNILLIISTLRMKAIGFVFACISIYLFIVIYKRKLSMIKLVIVGIVAILISFNQIKLYFVELNDSARSVLMNTSIKIANDYFPFGTGFATFGSHFSTVKYSPIYIKYKISNTYGLSKKYNSFVSDTFWPMIIGQFGYLGLILYLICLILIFIKIQKSYDVNRKEVYIAKLICFVYLIVSSTSESAFVNSIAIPLATIIGLNYNKIERTINDENKERKIIDGKS